MSVSVRGGRLEIRLQALGDDPGVDPPPAVIESIDMAFMVDTQQPEPVSQ